MTIQRPHQSTKIRYVAREIIHKSHKRFQLDVKFRSIHRYHLRDFLSRKRYPVLGDSVAYEFHFFQSYLGLCWIQSHIEFLQRHEQFLQSKYHFSLRSCPQQDIIHVCMQSRFPDPLQYLSPHQMLEMTRCSSQTHWQPYPLIHPFRCHKGCV